VIAAENQDSFRPFSLKNVDVLVNAVGGPAIPSVNVPLLWRHALDKLAEFVIENAPSQPNVAI
jgi:hypothetical protein